MWKYSLFAGFLALCLAAGCSSETKPGGDSAAPKFEGQAAAGDSAATETEGEAPDETMSPDKDADAEEMADDDRDEKSDVAEPEMKDEAEGAAETAEAPEADAEKPAASASIKTKAASDDGQPAPDSPADEAAPKIARKGSSRGLFKGLANSVWRGTMKTITGVKSVPATPPEEPQPEDDPFPNGEPTPKPAEGAEK